MTKLGLLSTHSKLLRSKSPLQSWCVRKSLKLDKPLQFNFSSNCGRWGRPLQLRHHIDDNAVLAIEALV
jgi:hypothetical protein